MNSNRHTPVLLVGAGPIGIEIGVRLREGGFEFLQIDAGEIGSTISWWAPGTTFFSSPERIAIAGMPLETPQQGKATREEYLAYLRSVVRYHALPIRPFCELTSLRRTDSGFEVTLRRSQFGYGSPLRATTAAASKTLPDEIWSADRIILAIGDMHRPRTLAIPGEELPQVSHYLQDPHHYCCQRVLIVGGKNSAAEAAIRLHRIGARVTMSYRQEEFDSKRVKYWLYPELHSLIKSGAIEFYPCSTVHSIESDRIHLRLKDGADQIDSFDSVLLLTGYTQDPTLFRQAGVVLEGSAGAPKINRSTMETNVPGLFVAGTAIAGSQCGEVKEFIETSHSHGDRIVAALSGRPLKDALEEKEVGLLER